MEEKTPNIVKIFIFLSLLSLVLITAVYAYTKLNGLNLSFSISNILPSSKTKSPDYGYNFAIPDTGETQESSEKAPIEEIPSEPVEPAPVEEVILSEEEVTFAVNSNATEAQIGNIVIPKISVNSPIFSGSNGTTLMDKGFWVYPSSFTPDKGEVILICHRRHFGQVDPRTCWNLHLLQKGDLIQINNAEGQPIRYLVTTVSVKDTQDVDIFSTSEAKILKIVSCSLPNGQPGGSVNRIVVSAEQL